MHTSRARRVTAEVRKIRKNRRGGKRGKRKRRGKEEEKREVKGKKKRVFVINPRLRYAFFIILSESFYRRKREGKNEGKGREGPTAADHGTS